MESVGDVGTESEKRDDEAIGRGEKVCTESGKQDDKAVGRRERPAGTKGGVRHSENYDWEGMGDFVDGYEDTEEVEKEKEERNIYYSVCALEDMPLMQRQDPELAEIITYLSTGDLPASDKAARKLLMLEDQFTLDDGVLWHFFAPKSRHAKRSLLPLRQLCVPSIPKRDILKTFHEHGSSHKCAETLFETIRQKYFWFNCIRMHCCIANYVEDVCQQKKNAFG